METTDFFSLVLPSEGLRCVIAALPKPKGWQHIFLDSNDAAADAVRKLDDRGQTVYFGCASFSKAGSRAGSNVAKVRSFWLDIDCGDGKPYANAKAGVVALHTFCTAVGLPMPLTVASGNGLHAYWPLTEDIPVEQWRDTAMMLRLATQYNEFYVDNSRTTDVASVLRPAGSHHRKAEPKKVRVVHLGVPVAHLVIHDALQEHLTALGFTPQVESAVPNLNSDLTGGQEFPPAYAERIVNGCGVMQQMRDTGGNLDQPTWYAMLGVLAFCEDGEKLAHEWSSGHPNYSEQETANKLSQAAKYKPTTCAKVSSCAPDICKLCRHNGQINSPIALGFQTQAAPVVTSTAQALDMPEGYRWAPLRQGMEPTLQFSLLDGDGNTVWFPFCQTLFYPISRIRTQQGMMTEIEMVVKEGQIRRFTVDCGTVARGGSDLSYELGKYEIVATSPKMKPHIDAYLQRWLDRNRTRAEEIATYHHFGWHEEGFLVGNTLLGNDGNQRQVLLGGDAKTMAGYLGEKGSFEVWRDVINEAYNYPGQEGLQYLIVTAFAAPLFSLFKEFGGVTVYAHSEGSGVGKTTAQRAGLSAWGNWQQLQLTDKQVTITGLYNTIGTLSNLPVVFDELTNMNNGFASDLVYNVSNGQGKIRANKDGSLQTQPHKWSTIMMASGNTMLTEKVSIHRANSEAELNRIFEFSLSSSTRLTLNRANELFPRLAENYGQAGKIFATYLVQNRAKIEQLLIKVQQQFNAEAGVLQQERFWSALQCSQLVALKICQHLGILSFPLEPFKTWILDQLSLNRVQKQEVAHEPLEIFGRMLADHWQGILVTKGEGDLRKNVLATVVQHPKGTLHGRAILALDPYERSVLLLNSSTIREWCNKRGCSMKEMFGAVVAAGIADANQDRYSLGRGTTEYAPVSSQVRCWVIDLMKMEAALGSSTAAQKIRIVTQGEQAHADAAAGD